MAGEDVHTGQEVVPDWMYAFQVGEEQFAAAYALAHDEERAFIKTAVAGLYAWLGPSQVKGRRTETELAQGLSVCAVKTPRKWAVVHIPASCAAPGLVLAAVLPLLAAGVWPLVVVLGEESQDQLAVLLALELAGIDTAYILPEELMGSALRCWQGMQDRGPGLVVQIGQETVLSCGRGGPLLISLPRPRRAAVWQEERDFDFQALSFAHPGMEFVVWAEQRKDLPPAWRQECGEWSKFLQQEVDVVWVPNSHLHQALEIYSLVLGPGQESLWVWPWYTPDLLDHTRLGLLCNA